MESTSNPNYSSVIFKPVQKLPKNFFEKILDLELKIKRDFNIERLRDLVHLYSLAVEFYESIEDERFKDYQNRLNILLSQPEILKKMNEFIIKQNSTMPDFTCEDKEKKNQTEMKKKQMKLKINYYINQINTTNQNKEVDKILEKIKNERKDETVGVNEIVNEEIQKQENKFKSKLEQKRKKNPLKIRSSHQNFFEKTLQEDNNYQTRFKRYLSIQNGSLPSNLSKISIHEIADANEFQMPIEEENKSEKSAKKSSHEEIHGKENFSQPSRSDNEDDDDYSDNSLDKYEDQKISELDEMFRNVSIRETNVNVSNLNENNESRIVNESIKSRKINNNVESQTSMIVKDSNEINEPDEMNGINEEEENTDNNTGNTILNNNGDGINRLENNENNLNNSFNSKNSKSKEVNASIFKIDDSLLESKHIGPKHRQIFLEIKDALEQFVNEFNFYFYEYVFQRFAEQIQRLMDEKYLKYVEVSKNYQSQIKEMEFIINGVETEDQHREGILQIVEALKEEQEQELARIEDYYDKLVMDAQNNFKNISFKNNPGVQLIEEKFKLDLYNLINLIISPYRNLNKNPVEKKN